MAASKSKARGGKELMARRSAALERAAVRVAAEREAAARAEEERLAREAEFDELAADFELAREDEDQVAAEVEAELRLVRERGQARIQEVRLVAARVVVAMGDKGETVAGCARRLGVGAERVKELRRLGREEGGGGEDGDSDAVDTAGGVVTGQEAGGRRKADGASTREREPGPGPGTGVTGAAGVSGERGVPVAAAPPLPAGPSAAGAPVLPGGERVL
ncbi:hypothetical protein OG730_41525 (plasmid) [Streptomyces sp. NBC_01298]|uniref:hypothetical protein n=1 Tax=Streptomyces sp. NBC_01298 TaxID=2903817 RepID=UPI002E15B804|nr:hypothetical protein OG730_42500 [Streptomyces sp. NBC_01298]WSK25950.1 hypothetical protein OG730_41525 [Streptomyces sp. NBC_01298]